MSISTESLSAWSPGLAKEMAPLYERVKRVAPEAQWMQVASYIHVINQLKRQRNSVLLAPYHPDRLIS